MNLKIIQQFTKPPYLKQYFKDGGDKNLLYFPWKLGGYQKQPQEQLLDPIVDVNQIFSENKVLQMIQQFSDSVKKNKLYEYQSFIEFSLAKFIQRETYPQLNLNYFLVKNQRTENLILNWKYPKYQTLNSTTQQIYIELGYISIGQKIDKIQFPVNYKNNYLKQKYKAFQTNIGNKNLNTYFKKKPSSNDQAIISIFLDVSFKSFVESHLSTHENQILFDQRGYEIHTIRFEIEVIKSDYRSLKNNLESGEWIKNFRNKISTNHPIIIDIDECLNGNYYIDQNL